MFNIFADFTPENTKVGWFEEFILSTVVLEKFGFYSKKTVL